VVVVEELQCWVFVTTNSHILIGEGLYGSLNAMLNDILAHRSKPKFAIGLERGNIAGLTRVWVPTAVTALTPFMWSSKIAEPKRNRQQLKVV
jgi:hypothetical protein